MPRVPYKLADGTRVPGVTTITGVYDGGKSNGLMSWAAKLGLQGIDARNYRDRAATIGTVAHDICTSHYLGTEPDYLDLTDEERGLAENSALTFFEWIADKDFEPRLVEANLVSEKHRCGGTPDLYGGLTYRDVRYTNALLDLKSSKTIFAWDRGRKVGAKKDYLLQVGGGYPLVLGDNGHHVDFALILGISKTEDYDFEEYAIQDIAACERGFLLCREMYDQQKGWK